jgi:hypothetical protein
MAQQSYNVRFKQASDTWALLATEPRAWWTAYAAHFNKIPRAEFIREFILQRTGAGIEPLRPVTYEGGAF